MTIILPCNCISEFQDQTYGKGRRVHNICQKGTNQYRVAYCTVCSPRQPKVKQNTSAMPIIGMMLTQRTDLLRQGKTISKK